MVEMIETSIRRSARVAVAGVVAIGLAHVLTHQAATSAQAVAAGVPQFQEDSSWPKALPNNWILGNVTSVAVDARDHVWVLHRPLTVPAKELEGGQKKIAPPVVELDPEGNVVQAWGGAGAGYSWMEREAGEFPEGGNAEHGIYVDPKDNVWVTGNGNVVLKFTRAGKFLLQIGELWKSAGSNDRKWLDSPTDMVVDAAANDVYVADGYVNRRVIVFDASTGAYRRHWGAYGKKPEDGPRVGFKADRPVPQDFYAVHCIRMSNDGLVYVCDRERNRLQVFQKNGTFVRELILAKETPVWEGPGTGHGSVWRVGFSPDTGQQYLYIGDGQNTKIWILTRKDLQVVGSFDTNGALHHMAGADSRGNLYTTGGRRPKRFVPKRGDSARLDRLWTLPTGRYTVPLAFQRDDMGPR